MRVNVYAAELPLSFERVVKRVAGAGDLIGLRFITHHDNEGNSHGITLWARNEDELRLLLDQAGAALPK